MNVVGAWTETGGTTAEQEDDPQQRHEGPLWSQWREETWWRDRVEPGSRLTEVEPMEVEIHLKNQGDVKAQLQLGMNEVESGAWEA